MTSEHNFCQEVLTVERYNISMIDVAIIDYKMGNLFSVQRACENVGLNSLITSDINIIEKSRAIILPGVGSFAEAMKNLDSLGLSDAIRAFIKTGKPFMGVCLGFQLLYTESEEFGLTKGLDILEGTVKKFPLHTSDGTLIRVPHIGWNQIFPLNNGNLWNDSLLFNIPPGEYMYFVHSYYVSPKNNQHTITKTEYSGFEFCSCIKKDNIFATQFHPEKSAAVGLKIYKQFSNYIEKYK